MESPHQVENIERSVAAAGNYLDEINWEDALRQFETSGQVEEVLRGSGASASIMNAARAGWDPRQHAHGFDSDQLSLPWEQFKRP